MGRKPDKKNKLFLRLCAANGLNVKSATVVHVPDTEAEMLKTIADLKRLKQEVRSNYFDNWT
jgi:hypothetical protein